MKLRKIAAFSLCSVLMTGSLAVPASAASKSTSKSSAGTVKVLAHYDVTKDSYGAKQFKDKNGGKIVWYPTTWESRYNDLATQIIGGEGIDLFPYESRALPSKIVSGLFTPVDSYINTKSSPWKSNSAAMDTFKFNGKHYVMVTDVTAENVVYYSKKTMKKYGFDDPYKLWQKGEWNWDVFEDDLKGFVNEKKGRYGLDGWYYANALYLSAGAPAIGVSNGKLVSNIDNKNLAKAMDFGYELHKNGLILDKSKNNWLEKPQLMGDGKELFYISGMWAIQSEPSNWSMKISASDLGMVPVPSPKGSKNYMGVTVSGFCLCKGSSNPKGAAKLAECIANAATDKTAVAEFDSKAKKTYKWSKELISARKKINKAAKKNPVIDVTAGTSYDIEQVLINGDSGVQAAFYGVKWSDIRDMLSKPVKEAVDEINSNIKSAGKKK